ncbi:MAG TPA: leucine-rich repeat domain-containing protein [Labilithrix sp.]|nr:leucine-rich repeat domain-containing protein [Labilithrix sp.]
MKRIALAVLVGLVGVVLVAGCDEDKKKAEILAKTASTDAGLPGPTMSAAVAAPSASATVEPPKKEVLCPPGPDLEVADKDLEAELRLKLARPKDPLRMSDLATVKSLNLTKKQSLDELDPCIIPKLTGLHHLYLGPGKLRDLKPIANLTSLESLRASINEVEDLKPLEKLVLLDRVDLGRSHVRDLAPIATLVNLTELQLDDTQVSDLAPLAKMKKLEKLSIKHTNVIDVSPLKGLDKLKFLYVEGCAIGNLDTIQPLVSRGLRVVTK